MFNCVMFDSRPTSPLDNALNMWIYDQLDGSCRLLKSRSGHSIGPNRARYTSFSLALNCVCHQLTLGYSFRFYDNQSGSILSAGNDSEFRSFSLVRDERNRELAQ